MGVPAGRGPRLLSFGVEEEFLLADTRTRSCVPRAQTVIAKAAGQLGERVREEFFAAQFEICTPPRVSAADLREDLAEARRVAVSAAAGADCLLVASGCAVLSAHPLAVVDEPRYHDIFQRIKPILDRTDGEISGCHVHLGTLERPEALALANRLRPWLPVFQAMTVNSPYAAAADRRHESWRSEQYALWPTVGPAPLLDERSYERTADDLVVSGRVVDRKAIYWYARPSEHLPTLEVRVMDVNADLRVTLLAAVLLRALGTVLLAEAHTGHPAPAITDAQVLDAHRQAARHGLRGQALDPVTGTRRPLRACLDSLVARSLPGLEAAGDAELAAELLDGLLPRGTGADQQRADYSRRRSFADVVDGLAARTART